MRREIVVWPFGNKLEVRNILVMSCTVNSLVPNQGLLLVLLWSVFTTPWHF